MVHAKATGRNVDAVAIPAPLNKESKVGYAIGKLKSGRSPDNTHALLNRLAAADAQAVYAKYGFGRASAEEPALKPL